MPKRSWGRGPLSEELTAAFYEWEVRGRGWLVFDRPVALEPPFRPFVHRLPPHEPISDDGRRHTWLSAAIEGAKSLFRPQPAPSLSPVVDDSLFDEPEPEYDEGDEPVVELRVSLPRAASPKPAVFEALLVGFSGLRFPASFEIIGSAEETAVQFACREPDRRALVESLRAYLPDVTIAESRDALERAWQETGERCCILHAGLAEEFMLPLRTRGELPVDPLVGVVAALGDLAPDELGILQVLFSPVRNPWAPSILRAVSDGDGGAFFADAPAIVPGARQKVAEPLFAAATRIAGASSAGDRAEEIARALLGALARLSEPGGNALAPLDDESYPAIERERDLLRRRSRRSGCLLNVSELSALVHFPGPEVCSGKLVRDIRRTKPAPQTAFGHALVLGENEHQGTVRQVSLSPDERVRHTHVIGASGTGKSTLLLRLIAQDIEAGHGIAVLDPHGDLIDEILSRVPEERLADVVLFDPSDEAYPVGFNILEAHSEIEKNLLASDLGAVFRRLATSWGDQMTAVLGNAILALLESERGGTLLTLRRFLADEAFRREFLASVRDPEVVFFFEHAFPLLAGRPQGPILTRLDTFLRPKIVRYIVSQRDTGLDFGAIMDEGKIFLGKLAQGAIGEENAHLLGALLVAKFQQLTIARQQQARELRRPFFCYIDEFHNFITPSMAAILSGARKYKLGLILAHQELRQLHGVPEVQSSVIANPHTRICFRLGDEDARKLADGFSFFTAEDLQNLETGEAIARIGPARSDFNLRTLPFSAVAADLAERRRVAIIEQSRTRYARPREAVEVMLAEERPEIAPSKGDRRKAAKAAAGASAASFAPAERIGEAARVAPAEPPSAPALKPAAKHPTLVSGEGLPPPLGRGGGRHKYLQQLIKQLAEQRGFRAVIEEPTGSGGRVDVALRRGEIAIACEISVTTDPQHELGNVSKCLAAGYGVVAMIGEERRQLDAIRRSTTAALTSDQAGRVLYLLPDELLSYLDQLPAEPIVAERSVRGYRVTVAHKPLSGADMAARRGTVARVIARSLKQVERKGGERAGSG